jgi:hypothetical protein
MIRRQRLKLVEARADLILTSKLTVEEYAGYFEGQMRRSKVRKLLHISYVQFTRSGALMLGFSPISISCPPTEFDT